VVSSSFASPGGRLSARGCELQPSRRCNVRKRDGSLRDEWIEVELDRLQKAAITLASIDTCAVDTRAPSHRDHDRI
jgi:hypothetical protein